MSSSKWPRAMSKAASGPGPPCRARDAGTAARARGFAAPATPPRPPNAGHTLCAPKAPDYTQFEILPFNLGRCTVDDRTLDNLAQVDCSAAPQGATPTWLGYADLRGSLRLREGAGAALSGVPHAACNATQREIVVLSGVQQAIDLVLRILVEPGDAVWIEDPTHPAHIRRFAGST